MKADTTPKYTDTTPKGVALNLVMAGASACLADAATFPFDTVKVRLQLQGEQTGRLVGTKNVVKLAAKQPLTSINAFHSVAVRVPTSAITTPNANNNQYRGLCGTLTTIARQEGPRSLYNGLSAGLQRQCIFASIRLGLYDVVTLTYQDLLNENPEDLNVMTRVMAGLTTGALAGLFGQPTEVVKVRFQSQRRLPGVKLKYTSTLATYQKVGREDGIRGLWKGAVPTIGRNSIVNVFEIVGYDVSKQSLMRHGGMSDNIYCHFSAAAISGFAAILCASPVDVIKTRYTNSSKGQYNGVIDCAVRMATQEGFTAFYKGFIPAFARLVTWNIGLWITYEQIKRVVYPKKS